MAKTYKERFAELKAKGKKGLAKARETGGKAKPFVIAGGAGAAVHYGLRMLDANVPSVTRSSKYAPGAVALVTALVVNKKSHTAALGIAGAAGLLLAQAFDSAPAPAPAPQPTTKGYGDAAAMQDQNTSALELPDAAELVDTGAFVETSEPEMYN